MKNHKDYKKFIDKFWSNFFNIPKEKKLEILNYGFENVPNFIEKSELSQFYNVKTYEEYLYRKEERKFLSKYKSNLFHCPFNIKDKLYKFWFENFQKEIENKSWLKNILQKFCYFNLTKEEFEEKTKNIPKWLDLRVLFYFNESFENSLIYLSKEKEFARKNNLWKEFLSLPLEERIKIVSWETIFKQKENKENLFFKKYWFWYANLIKKDKEKLHKLWFENIPKYLEEEKPLIIAKFFDKTIEEYRLFKEREKFEKRFWQRFTSLSKEQIWELLKIWFDNVNVPNKNWALPLFLYELKHWKFFDIIDEKFYCKKCWKENIFWENNKRKIENCQSWEYICIHCFPKYKQVSEKEMEVLKFVKQNYKLEILSGYKYLKNNKDEFDIFLPDLKIAIEFNWNYWHQDKRHLRKYKYCLKHWIEFILIWEDQWELYQEEVKEKLLIKLWISKKKISLKDCEFKEISNNKIWAFCKWELIWELSFYKDSNLLEFNLKNKVDWLLQKFFDFFKEKYNWEKCLILSDNQWGNWKEFEEIWFKYIWDEKLKCFYVHHRTFERFDFDKTWKCFVNFDLGYKKFIYKKEE